MKGKNFIWLIVLTMVLSFAIFLSGCGGQSGDHDNLEEPEISVEYLSGEFAQQLLRDGGEEMLGTVDITKEKDGTYFLTIRSMAIVENSAYDGGYYIADKNLTKEVPLDSEARATYIKSKKSGPQVMKLDQFIKAVQDDNRSSDSKNSDEKLYKVYIIGGNALMLLAEELPG